MNEKLREQKDSLVRDACSVVPMPKSDFSRRLDELCQEAVRQTRGNDLLILLDEVKLEGYKPYTPEFMAGHSFVFEKIYNRLQALKQEGSDGR